VHSPPAILFFLQIEAEKAAKEAEFKRRHDEEAARIRAIGLDNKKHFNIAFCGVSGAIRWSTSEGVVHHYCVGRKLQEVERVR
jgi:hypothetical protein